MVVLPVNAFAPVRTIVPFPAVVSAEFPLTTPLTVNGLVELLLQVCGPFKAMGAARVTVGLPLVLLTVTLPVPIVSVRSHRRSS